jgi:ABC-2 type transport system permease protein
MYLCAIFYPVERLMKSGFYWLLKFNPLYCIITIFRASIFGEMMNIHYFLYALGFSVVTIVVGLVVFIKKQDEFILNI